MSNLRFDHPIFTVTLHLFRQYLVDNDLDTEEAEKVTIKQFYEWGQARREENSHENFPAFPDANQLLELYDITEEDLATVDELFEDPFNCVSELHIWWPLITLSTRGVPVNKISSIAIMASIKFENGYTIHLPKNLPLAKDAYGEGALISLWRSCLNAITEMVSVKTMDKIYAENAIGGKTSSIVEVDQSSGQNYDIC
jgi:hypothetical protein